MKFPLLEQYGLQDQPFTCAQCSFCQVGNGACPTYKVKRRDSYSGKGKMILARTLIQGRIKPSEGLEGLRDAIFGCTLCGGCEEICQVDIPFVKIYQLLRADFLRRGMWPEELVPMKETLVDDFNVQGQDNDDRVEGWSYWHPDEDALLEKVGQNAKTAFFFGCNSSFRGVPIQGTIATLLIMDKIGEDYTVLGDEEWCCGAPLIMTGDFDSARKFAEHNIKQYKELGVQRIVTNCPGCYKMWAHEYHEFLDIDHPFEVVYGAQYFSRLIDEGKLAEFTNPLDVTVTFHDGCDAGRNSGIYEEPRKVLEHLPGVTLEELPHNKANCYCCGSGGVLRPVDADFALEINKLKVEDIEQTSADWVIAACPSCVDFMNDQLPQTGSQKRVKDLSVLVAEALGLTWDGLDEIYG
ncbi:MAG: (Fe-S)-binding protein [Candidatus Thorarchaeota archaeon]|nr:MAG: (Fe-S)-binding protein [Candidatus Thorarchaeota archaeon]